MTKKMNILTTLVIGLCFLWTSCGYLSWLYNLMELVDSSSVDWLTEVIGYLFQALGIFLFYIYYKKKESPANNKVFIIVSLIDFIFVAIGATASNLTLALIAGYCMNLFHGFVAAIYLHMLFKYVSDNKKGLSFGIGYSIGSIGAWLISKIDADNFLKEPASLIVYFVIIVLSVLLYRLIDTNDESDELTANDNPVTNISITKSTIAIISFAIIVVCALRGIGFYFPMADISDGINLEFSRIFYAFGLISAGLICDKKRSLGAISSVCALVFPFINLVLSNQTNASIIFWILGYIFVGFLNVYRVVLFSDISKASKSLSATYFCAFGLMFGRIGDALGSLGGIALSDNKTLIVTFSSILFVISVILMFALYERLYMTPVTVNQSEDDILFAFANKYNISARELDVLKHVITNLSNGEISAKLFISENTVKFHIRNILKKTSCTNRNELINLYKGGNNES